MYVAVGANTALSTLINQIGHPLGPALRTALLEMVVLTGLTCAVLYALARTGRIVQSLTALMGAESVIGGLVFVSMVAIPALPPLLHLGIFLWNVAVIAHVLRHALDTRFMVGVLFAIGYAFTLNQLEVFVANLLSATT